MVLRLYKKSSCVDVIAAIDRLIWNEEGKVEVRSHSTFQWNTYNLVHGKDYDSFVLAKE